MRSSGLSVLTGWEEPFPGEPPGALGASPSSLMEPPALPHPPSSSSPPLIYPLLTNLAPFT